MDQNTPRWDVDFTLSLHNRTGKYFIGRDLLDGLPGLFGRVWVWRVPTEVSGRLARRTIGRLWVEEDRARSRLGALPPRQASARAVLHLDPMTVLSWRVGPRDAVLCHDLGPITHPDLFAPAVVTLYRRAYARMVETRPKVAFVSQASRDAFEGLYGILDSTAVIYPPIRAAAAEGAEAVVDGVGAQFLLTVGSIGRRKNQLASVRAFAAAGLAARGFQYVLCGSREPGADEVVVLAAQTPGVLVLPYVSDEQLRWLYARASGFVLASLLEGFGVPVAEAMRYGVVPLVSANSVLEEVAGPMAITVDPVSVESIAAGMARLVALDAAALAGRRAGLQMSLDRFTSGAFLAGWRAFLAR